jgi:hypothetical protein
MKNPRTPAIAGFLTLILATRLFAAGNDVTIGTVVTEWSSATLLDAVNGIYPVGGSGQLNGEFVVVERDGVQIGLRATDRTDGLLVVSGVRTGTYQAATGYDPGTLNRAEWNYDIHLDLRGTGKTLADYTFTLTQTFAPKLNGSAGPLDLKFPDMFEDLLDNAVLYQLSLNPVFFNDSFDVDREGTYHLMLKMQPLTGGPPLIAQIRVVVTNEI